MLDGVAMDYRTNLRDRLSEKRNELGQTELSLKKYGASGFRRPMGERLGPVQGRIPAGLRLGPKVTGTLEKPGDVGGPPVQKRSRIVVVNDGISREEVLEAKKRDSTDMQRNRRIFGNLMGTLQRFRREETRVNKERELKKREVEKKIEEKTEKEKEDARKQKEELFEERRRQRREIRVLQHQMKRVEEFEVWESAKRKQMGFIRTKVGPPLFYLPRTHNDSSMTALEETMDAIEEEIKVTKSKFEEDLLKIEAKIDNFDQDDDDDDDEEDFAEKPKSIISKPSETNGSTENKNSHEDEKEENGDVEEKKIIKIVEVEEEDVEMKEIIEENEEDKDEEAPLKIIKHQDYQEEESLVVKDENSDDKRKEKEQKSKTAGNIPSEEKNKFDREDFFKEINERKEKNQAHKKKELEETGKKVEIKKIEDELSLVEKEISLERRPTDNKTKPSRVKYSRKKSSKRRRSSSSSSSSSPSSSSSSSSSDSSSSEEGKNRKTKKRNKKTSSRKRKRRNSSSSSD